MRQYAEGLTVVIGTLIYDDADEIQTVVDLSLLIKEEDDEFATEYTLDAGEITQVASGAYEYEASGLAVGKYTYEFQAEDVVGRGEFEVHPKKLTTE